MTKDSYRAVEARGNGKLHLVDRPLQEPPAGYVRVRVDACGICHSDAYVIEGSLPPELYPIVPGHEVVGHVEKLGDGVIGWQIGQRVGVGFMGGACGACEQCRRGKFVACIAQESTGMNRDGGYAESIVVKASGLVAVPADLASTHAAPLLCAGITTFNALRRSGALAGQVVAIQGVGGLGHLGIQYARRMGYRVVAIARGERKRELAMSLGAHLYIDSEAEDPVQGLKALGGASAILCTATSASAMSALVPGLTVEGKLIVVGVGSDSLIISPMDIFMGERTVWGSVVGSPIECEDMLDFSLLQEVMPMVEEVDLEDAQEGYDKMMRNEARFRMVLTMERKIS